MTFSLISDDGIQRFHFYSDAADSESMVYERHALVARAPGKAKHVASWRKTGQFLVSKERARKLWRELVSLGYSRHDVHVI